MEQFDQLLTCCVCLDRYRNPKLLPCQHSFCMEPCMEGLVDYVRRQVKCPECRAEHRIPYQGVQAFPTNVTLQRFLELHIDLTGELPDPTSNQIMERCQICSEKAYLNSCAHCEKKVCPDCKEAHVEVVKREITRLSSQVRRTLTRLEDALSVTEKSLNGLKGNQNHVLDEVDDIVRRFTKAINDKADTIRHELEHYVSTELTTLNSYKTNLETELANIQSNCELVDKHMVAEGTGGMSWDDQELMDTKDIFLKTLEFIRNFDYEPGDRRIRFSTHQDTNQLAVTLANFGELILPTAIFAALFNSKPAPVQPPPVQPSPGIMRSKSDHRLVQQYRDMDDMDEKASSFRSKYSKYGGGGGGGDGESRFRRLTRKLVDDDDDDGRLGGFNDGEDRPKAVPTRARVIETDDAVKGPLSGVSRLLDSTRVLEKMVEFENPRRKATPTGPAAVPLAILQMQQHMQKLLQQKQQQQSQTPTTPTSPSAAPWRQNSLDKSSAASKASSVAPLSRQQSKVDKPRSESESSSSDHHSGSGSSSGSSSRKVSTGASFTTEEIKRRFSNTAVPQTSSNSSTTVKSSTPASSTVSKYRRNLTPVASASKLNKDEDDSETTSDESEETESDEPVTTPAKSLSRMEKTDIGPLLARSAIARDREPASTSSSVASHRRDSSLRDYDSYRPRDHEPTTTSVRQRDHHESIRPRDIEPISTSASRSRFADTSSSDQSRRTRDPPPLERRVSRDEGSQPGSMYTAYRNRQPKSPPERHYGSSSGTSGSGAGSSAASRYGTSSSTTSSPYDYGLSRSRTGTSLYDPPESSTSRLQAKYLNRSRHNLGGSIDVPDDHVRPSGNPYYTGRSSYLAKPGVGAGAERRDSNAGLSSREKSKLLLSKSKSHHELAQPDHEIRDDENLSSWARYLKNKYGKTVTPYTPTSSSSSNAYQSQPQSPTSPLSDRDRDPFHDIMGTSSSTKINRSTRGKSATPQSHTITTAQYSGKKRLIFKFGSRGSDPGQFTWPRGIACGADGLIAVADSSNHRIQVFDPRGRFLKEFGSYGNSDCEFDCLAGVTINKIGQFVVSDRYNHRVQVFDPSCKFLRSFGSQGSGDGKFNHPWGITTDSLGFIYVCDKDNHRIQVFQSDGSFVGKFGAAELNSPHYIAVTNTNKVVVSDTGHHRVCIFDVNGKILATFGTEGIEHGQFKLPRGVAVDDQGYIFVADSGNNRIQIFNPDGVHIKSFGSWGSGDREFKGLEGITVNSEGNVFVCDRENHRIQVF